jgi:6-phosphogluconolactonase (cycloisomerase 2 family)
MAYYERAVMVCFGRWVRGAFSAAGFTAAILLTGCGNFGSGFFQDPNTSTTTTATATTGDYVYSVNSGNTLSEFSVGSAALTPVSGSPVTLATGLNAASVAVSRANTFVFVGGDGGIYVYTIGTGGALASASDVTEEANFVSLDTSPDGQWLFALDNLNNEIWVFSITSSTGALKLQGSQYPLQVGSTVISAATAPGRMVRMAPDGGLLAVAIGTAGDEVFTFNTTTGVLTSESAVEAPASGYSDDSIAFDGTSTVAASHLLIGRGITSTGTSQILAYTVTSAGALGSTASAYTSGQDPYSLLIDLTGAYLFAANRGSSTVAGYTIANGALTGLASSPYASGSEVTALAEDNTKKFVIAAAAGGSSDLTLYAFDALTAGQLDAVATSANGSGVAGSIAVATTH